MQLVKPVNNSNKPDDLRLFPFIFAGVICFTIAVILGVGSWYLFNLRRTSQVATASENDSPSIVSENENLPMENSSVQVEPSPVIQETTVLNEPKLENVVEVSGGEVAIGGGDTAIPLERVIVGKFFIAETEVTNSQYAEFLKETNHPAPPDWNKMEFPTGTGNFPVRNVSWNDAAAFCDWMSKKLNTTVRLPGEAEWELAARGSENYKYPWGNDWKKDAVISKETGGEVSEVKKFPLNRSPFGAFDMVGNVWEWTQEKVGKNEEVTDKAVEEALESGRTLRIVKGGSAKEKTSQLSAQARYEIPEKTKVPMVGFRYVIIPK